MAFRPVFSLFFACVAVLTPIVSTAQSLADTSGLTLDLLQIPNSPAFSLMDLAPSTIEEAKVPADFAVFLRNSTDSFTTFPRSYGLEFAPWWVFGRDRIDFSRFASNRLADNVRQSFTVSVGVNHLDDPNLPAGNDRTVQTALGFKVSLCRGRVEQKHQQLDSLYNLLAAVNDSFYTQIPRWLRTDPTYRMWADSVNTLRAARPINALALQEAGTRMSDRSNELLSDSVAFQRQIIDQIAPQYALLKAQAAGFRLNRRGFKLDLGGGMVTDFFNQEINDAQITRVGGWLTGSWVFAPKRNNLNISILGIARVLGNPAQLYRPTDGLGLRTGDNLYFDYGARLVLHNGKRFGLSSEVLGRQPINNAQLRPSTRYVINMDYQLNSTILLSFQFGKNFDGTVTRSGNLISALQLFTTLGRRTTARGTVL
jgi:hypothetical protein